MKVILERLKPYRKRIILGQSFKFTEVILELLVPLLIAKMVDLGVANQDSGLVIQYS